MLLTIRARPSVGLRARSRRRTSESLVARVMDGPVGTSDTAESYRLEARGAMKRPRPSRASPEAAGLSGVQPPLRSNRPPRGWLWMALAVSLRLGPLGGKIQPCLTFLPDHPSLGRRDSRRFDACFGLVGRPRVVLVWSGAYSSRCG